MPAAVHGVVLVEVDAVTSGDLRHLGEQLATLHTIRLAACQGKSTGLPWILSRQRNGQNLASQADDQSAMADWAATPMWRWPRSPLAAW
jgi:alpha-D-ribose 1-methylphosphonate 5-triphosphate synthase subunit PhnG